MTGTWTCWVRGRQIPCNDVAKYQGAETSGPLPPGSYGWISTHTSDVIPVPPPSHGITVTTHQIGIVHISNQCSTGIVANVGGKSVYVPPFRAVSVSVDIPTTYTLTSEGETVGQGTITKPGEYISPQFCPTLTPSPTPGPTPSPSPSGGGGGTSGGLTTTTTTTTTTPTTGGIPVTILIVLVILGVLILGGST